MTRRWRRTRRMTREKIKMKWIRTTCSMMTKMRV